MVNIPKTLRSFRYAGQGMVALFRYENNARFHALAGGLVIGAGLWLGLTTTEWAILLTQIGLIFMGEAINTALEKLCDVVSPAQHPTIKAVKDMAAGAVLILAIVSVLVGLLILGPKLLVLLTHRPGDTIAHSLIHLSTH